MNILVMVHDMMVPGRGGGAPRTEATARAFIRLGHNVFVLSPMGVPAPDAGKALGGCTVIPTRNVDRNDRLKHIKHGLYSPILLARTVIEAKRHNIDMIFAHDSIYGFPAMLTSKILGIPFVLDATDLISEYVNPGKRSSIIHRILVLGESVVIKKAARTVTVSMAMKSILQRMGAHDVEVVYDGVDPKIFRPHTPLRKRKSTFTFVYQGGMDPQDGLEILVPAAEAVIKQHGKARFLLVGDGRMLPEIKKQVEEKGLQGYFHFTGWVPFKDVARHISDSDVGLVILPNTLSARIRVTLKTFEYWACGKPIVVSRLDALEEIVDERTGLFYEPGDAQSLAEKMLKIANDKKAYDVLARNGTAKVRKFDWHILGENIAKISLH